MEKAVFEKLTSLKNQYIEVKAKLEDPQVMSDIKQYTALSKEEKKLQPKVELFNKFETATKEISDLLNEIKREKDKDMIDMLQMQIDENKLLVEKLEVELKEILVEKDPTDERNAIFEIQGAVGGDEGNIFAGDLYWMYQKYALKNGFKIQVLDSQEAGHGGFEYINFKIIGDGAYGRFKFESGVHRVQRVPATEAMGRIHTSTATVLVLPEAEEVDFQLNPSEIKMDTYRSGGAGGQHVNKTESAVRLTHIPTGVVVACQEGRSQHANRELAMEMLRTKLFEAALQKRQNETNAARRLATGSGERSEKIRTYNYPENRITDHRIGLTLKKLDRIIEGVALGELLDTLASVDAMEKLANETK